MLLLGKDRRLDNEKNSDDIRDDAYDYMDHT